MFVERLLHVHHGGLPIAAIDFQPHAAPWPVERLATAAANSVKIWVLHSHSPSRVAALSVSPSPLLTSTGNSSSSRDTVSSDRRALVAAGDGVFHNSSGTPSNSNSSSTSGRSLSSCRSSSQNPGADSSSTGSPLLASSASTAVSRLPGDASPSRAHQYSTTKPCYKSPFIAGTSPSSYSGVSFEDAVVKEEEEEAAETTAAAAARQSAELKPRRPAAAQISAHNCSKHERVLAAECPADAAAASLGDDPSLSPTSTISSRAAAAAAGAASVPSAADGESTGEMTAASAACGGFRPSPSAAAPRGGAAAPGFSSTAAGAAAVAGAAASATAFALACPQKRRRQQQEQQPPGLARHPLTLACCVWTAAEHQTEVAALRWSPGGHLLASCDTSGHLLVYALHCTAGGLSGSLSSRTKGGSSPSTGPRSCSNKKNSSSSRSSGRAAQGSRGSDGTFVSAAAHRRGARALQQQQRLTGGAGGGSGVAPARRRKRKAGAVAADDEDEEAGAAAGAAAATERRGGKRPGVQASEKKRVGLLPQGKGPPAKRPHVRLAGGAAATTAAAAGDAVESKQQHVQQFQKKKRKKTLQTVGTMKSSSLSLSNSPSSFACCFCPSLFSPPSRLLCSNSSSDTHRPARGHSGPPATAAASCAEVGSIYREKWRQVCGCVCGVVVGHVFDLCWCTDSRTIVLAGSYAKGTRFFLDPAVSPRLPSLEEKRPGGSVVLQATGAEDARS